MNRETIYAALFAKLQSAAPFATASRRFAHWSSVTAAQQPALFQVQKGESVKPILGIPPAWTLAVDVYIYATTGDPANSSSAALNPLIDAVAAALAPDSMGKQTLGGLVSHCWIEGDIRTDEGVLGDQGVATIPVRILVC